MSEKDDIVEKLKSTDSELERYLILLDKLKEITRQIDSIETEFKSMKSKDVAHEQDIDKLELTVKEIETINKYVKDYLDRSLVWMIGIVSFVVSILIALLGTAVTMILSHAKG